MKVEEKVEQSEYDEWRSFLTIEIDGEEVFSVHDGEPEDNTLIRNFNDCYKVKELIEQAYQRGLAEGRIGAGLVLELPKGMKIEGEK